MKEFNGRSLDINERIQHICGLAHSVIEEKNLDSHTPLSEIDEEERRIKSYFESTDIPSVYKTELSKIGIVQGFQYAHPSYDIKSYLDYANKYYYNYLNNIPKGIK